MKSRASASSQTDALEDLSFLSLYYVCRSTVFRSIKLSWGLTQRRLCPYIRRFLRPRRRDHPFLSRAIRLAGVACLALSTIFTSQAKFALGLSNPLASVDALACSAPAFVDIDNDGDLDAFVGTAAGSLQFHENTGDAANPTFVERTGGLNPLSSVDVGFISAPAFVDIDNDGDFDLFIGSTSGSVFFFENNGSAASASFIERTGSSNPLNDSVIGGIVSDDSTPAFVDIDNDGDFDVFIGDLFGTVHFFRNSDPDTPSFTSPPGAQNPLKDASIGFSSAPTFGDFDGDGDFDCMVGELDGKVFYYENAGTAMNASFTQITGEANPLDGISVPGRSTPAMVDIDDDGDVDSFIGGIDGLVVFVENVESTPSSDVYVDFTSDSNGTGTVEFPFNNLADAVAASASGGIIHIEPGLSPEIFTGETRITKAVRLVNNGVGTVRIGLGGRSAEGSGTAGPGGGFVSRSGKARSRR